MDLYIEVFINIHRGKMCKKCRSYRGNRPWSKNVLERKTQGSTAVEGSE